MLQGIVVAIKKWQNLMNHDDFMKAPKGVFLLDKKEFDCDSQR